MLLFFFRSLFRWRLPFIRHVKKTNSSRQKERWRETFSLFHFPCVFFFTLRSSRTTNEHKRKRNKWRVEVTSHTCGPSGAPCGGETPRWRSSLKIYKIQLRLPLLRLVFCSSFSLRYYFTEIKNNCELWSGPRLGFNSRTSPLRPSYFLFRIFFLFLAIQPANEKHDRLGERKMQKQVNNQPMTASSAVVISIRELGSSWRN